MWACACVGMRVCGHAPGVGVVGRDVDTRAVWGRVRLYKGGGESLQQYRIVRLDGYRPRVSGKLLIERCRERVELV